MGLLRLPKQHWNRLNFKGDVSTSDTVVEKVVKHYVSFVEYLSFHG
jgi:hypothetical protein